MFRGRSRHVLFAVAAGLCALAAPRPAAHAHGPAPAALGVLVWDGEQAELIRLNVGLARRVVGDRFRFICPALWGDERGVPAAPLASGEVVLAAGSGLFLLSAQGAPRPHPDPNARGVVLDVVQAGADLYALRVAGGQSELLAIDDQRVRTLWSDASVFFSIAADERRVLLLRTSALSLAWQWLDLEGGPDDAGELALSLPVDYAFARLSRGQPYALVLEQGRPELGSFGGGAWVSLAKGAGSIAGPQAIDDVELLAVDGQLAELQEATTPLAQGPYVSCLDQLGELPYACTRDGLARLSADGVGESLFTLSQLAPPDLSVAADQEQRRRCDYQWQDLRFDLRALGLEVSLDPEPDAGSDDAGAPQDASESNPDAGASRRAPNGCSAQQTQGAQLSLMHLLVLVLVIVRVRESARRSTRD
jgi:hypothetical protein